MEKWLLVYSVLLGFGGPQYPLVVRYDIGADHAPSDISSLEYIRGDHLVDEVFGDDQPRLHIDNVYLVVVVHAS